MQEWFRIELTYNSNALEGNTLTKRETALVVEEGLTIGGKSLKDHLEAINHAYALDYIKELATKKRSEITLTDILNIHRLILKGIDDAHAGAVRKIQVKISGSDVTLPDPLKVPELMQDFMQWLQTTHEDPRIVAALAHFKLVAIHPFVDGNGRVARLLMNLLLMQSGYPPAIIEKEKKKEYIDAIVAAEKHADFEKLYMFIFQPVGKSFDIYINAAEKTVA